MGHVQLTQVRIRVDKLRPDVKILFVASCDDLGVCFGNAGYVAITFG